MKSVLIFGGTGFIGSVLTKALQSTNHKVTIVTRKKGLDENDYFYWDFKDKVRLNDVISKHEAIINLVGSPIVGKRWSNEYKRDILESRTKPTKLIVDAINNFQGKYLLNASAIGYYGYSADKTFTETSEPATEDFVSEVCIDWEKAANHLNEFNSKTTLRIGIVLGKNGGALAKMATPFKFFVGAALGDGKQWVSWISLYDLISQIMFLIDNELTGVFNGTSPNPVTNMQLSQAIANALSRPILPLNVPSFIMELMLGESACVVMQGQKVLPVAFMEHGFNFRDTDVQDYLAKELK